MTIEVRIRADGRAVSIHLGDELLFQIMGMDIHLADERPADHVDLPEEP